MSLGLDQYPLENTPTCGNAIPTFVARIDSYPVSIAKGIAFSLGAKLDEDKGCDTADQYIMSSPFPVTNVNSPNQGNQWRFSNCSIDSIKSFFNSSSTDCLTTQDIIYDLESYDSSPTITDLLSLNEQCQLLFQRNSTICDTGAIDCFSGSQACNVSGVCESIDVPQNTPCNTGNNYVCEYGFCVSNSSQSSSSSTSTGLQTTTVTPSSTTGSTKKPDDCVVETGYVEFDLPGCGCCGRCGCEKTCSQCEPGLPAYNQSESCTKEANCCGSKVRMRTLYVSSSKLSKCNFQIIR
ncbi:uncharacterized protein LOC132717523 [Ruditapes philippinarum]|uniref:uncharacterized protein LOC132717523 n=1 Tax=Ruditapes philippinarum TaxID=129788 RepID=UPI00295ADAE2|nr:uncharacterized protein LOC132717523 [Ruditapes philippinarum]